MPHVLILGATSDVAVACAHEFSGNRYDIQLAGRNTAMLQPIEKDLTIRYKNNVTVHHFDAADFDSHANFYGALSPKPDVVICVFGLLGDQAESARNWSACKQVLDANFTGAVSILNVVANDFEERKKGMIVGISSVAGERGRQSNYLYGSAKAGFTAYLSGMRNRLFPAGVHVVTVKPGFINTRMTAGLKLPKPLTAQPEHVGKAVFNATKSRKNVVYVLWMWRWIMLIIRNIPESIFKKLKM